MKEVNQRHKHDPDNGVSGDCWKACIASILEFPYEAVPDFQNGPSEVEIQLDVHAWARHYGIWVYRWDTPEELFPRGYSIAIGPSPRFKSTNHCCVALDGKVVFDPHPDKTGLESISHYESFEDLARVRWA